MTDSTIGFSAQCGGPDADTTITPIWMSLNALAEGFHLRGIPFDELAFMLRVDGKVSEYGVSDPIDNFKKNKRQGYLSVDIGIKVTERERAVHKIIEGMRSTADYIQSQGSAKSLKIDYDQLAESIEEFCTLVENADI